MNALFMLTGKERSLLTIRCFAVQHRIRMFSFRRGRPAIPSTMLVRE